MQVLAFGGREKYVSHIIHNIYNFIIHQQPQKAMKRSTRSEEKWGRDVMLLFLFPSLSVEATAVSRMLKIHLLWKLLLNNKRNRGMNRKTISSQLKANSTQKASQEDDLDTAKIKIKTIKKERSEWVKGRERENERECVAWITWKNIKVTFGFYCNFLLLYSSEFSFVLSFFSPFESIFCRDDEKEKKKK